MGYYLSGVCSDHRKELKVVEPGNHRKTVVCSLLGVYADHYRKMVHLWSMERGRGRKGSDFVVGLGHRMGRRSDFVVVGHRRPMMRAVVGHRKGMMKVVEQRRMGWSTAEVVVADRNRSRERYAGNRTWL